MFRETIEAILKPSTIDAIRASTRATCEVLDPEPDSVAPVALTPGREVVPGGSSTLKGLLLDPRSWYFAKKRCLPRQTARFRLHRERGSVSVVVGFSCVGWIVTGPAERRGGFFDPVAGQVRELLKATFPEFASPRQRSMWRVRIIAELRSLASAAEGRVEQVATADRPRD
jgi:hypothetical protein